VTPPEAEEAMESVPHEPGGDSGEQADASPEEIAEVATEFLTGLLEAMQLEADVESSVQQGRALLNISGADLGILIGRRGQTLDALQEVTRTAVQRRLRSHVKLLVDVESYRARRRASLADYAQAMASRAKERGTEIELEPMNAYERKVVHDAIAKIDGASSFSEGEEPLRKVIVRGE
jgi:spoIIIJ-associated protein